MAHVARNGVLVERDLELLAWLDRLVGASLDQVRARFDFGRTQAYRRLQVLRARGLVHRQSVLAGRPPLYGVMARVVGPSGYEHGFAISELVVARERAGARVITDVELRRERAGQGVLDGALTEGVLEIFLRCPRTPDVVEELEEGGLRAYEIELSSKGRTRREAILAAYAASDYGAVEWVVPNGRLAALIRAEIREMRLADFMEVRR